MQRTIKTSDFHGNEYEVALEELRWRPSAYAIVIHKEKVLLTKQMKTLHLPGGGVEFGEMPEQAVIRETKEETGIDIANPRLVECISGFFTFPFSKKGIHAQTLLLFYRCDFAGGELSTDWFTEEEKAFGEMPEWVPLDQLDGVKTGGSIDWVGLVKRTLNPEG